MTGHAGPDLNAADAAHLAAERLGVQGPGWVWQTSALLDAPGWFCAVQHSSSERSVLRDGGVALIGGEDVVLLWSPMLGAKAWTHLPKTLRDATANRWSAEEVLSALAALEVR